jgi:hypothetical protein
MLTVAATLHDYFDGDTPGTSSAGTVHPSVSTRTIEAPTQDIATRSTN